MSLHVVYVRSYDSLHLTVVVTCFAINYSTMQAIMWNLSVVCLYISCIILININMSVWDKQNVHWISMKKGYTAYTCLFNINKDLKIDLNEYWLIDFNQYWLINLIQVLL